MTDDISDKDRKEIERRMHDEVLETDGFSEIIYECPRASSIQKMGEELFLVSMNGELSLHGVTRNQPVSARVTLKGDMLRAAGEFAAGTLHEGDPSELLPRIRSTVRAARIAR